jgi:pyruvate formate-lyase/glycerol dehydratase family glycyl radical enzyme
MKASTKPTGLVEEFCYPEELQKGMRSDIGSTERVRKLSLMLRSLPARICLHRARCYTEVFSETEGEPLEIRYAKAFSKTLQDLPTVIEEGELIVGVPACGLKKVGVNPEAQATWLIGEIEGLPLRMYDPFEISPGQVREAKELFSYWQGKTVLDLWSKFCPPEVARKVRGSGWGDTTTVLVETGCHFTPAWELILEKGFSWYEARVKEQLSTLDITDPKQMGKEHFYKGLLIVIEAVKNFAAKYADKARDQASKEKDPKRKKELFEISEVLDRVPYYGARSFREAIQAVWFVHMLFHIEGNGPVYTIGRFDYYMYPYYKADLDKGLLIKEDAQELIECLFLKISGILRLTDALSSQVAPGYVQHQTISIGGVDNKGKDASNELSYLVLEAARSVRTIQPDIVLLCHPRETPYDLKMKGAELVALGLGLPKFVNTETIKKELMRMGYSLEEAEVGWIKGCTEPYGPGYKQFGHSSSSKLNLPIALEAVLFNGRKRTPNQLMSAELVGIETGDCRQFKTFDEFMAAFKTQVAQQIRDAHIAGSYLYVVHMRYFPVLLQSLLTERCIERGQWANAGGAEIPTGPGIPSAGGIGTAADSLAAIKKLVYEEKKITMRDLVQAIEANFEGYETLRQKLINDAPKFGNDIDYVDSLAKEIWTFANSEVSKYITPLGNKNMPANCVTVGHIPAGRATWATPDGRKAGEVLSNQVGPTSQRDVNGPLAHIKSVTKLGLDSQFGTVHNMYLEGINSREQVRKMIDLIDLYFSYGGHHLQINCQDRRVFIDAQKHPEKYPTLLVRVAGYIANFIELPKSVQDEIIARTRISV